MAKLKSLKAAIADLERNGGLKVMTFTEIDVEMSNQLGRTVTKVDADLIRQEAAEEEQPE